MSRYSWSSLNHLQLGRYAEYFVKMEFTMLGVDIYSAEVDDHGIDFVARTKDGKHYDVQVKSVYKSESIYFPKATFTLRKNLLAAIVIFEDLKEPRVYLIQATQWLTPHDCFKSYDYIGKESEKWPEWGLLLSKKYSTTLESHLFHNVVSAIIVPEKRA